MKTCRGHGCGIRCVLAACVTGLGPGAGLAEDAVFSLGGADIVLEDVSAEAKPFYRFMRFNRAANVWNVDVQLTNAGARTLTAPFVLRVESFSNTSGLRQPDGTNEGRAFLDLSATVPDGSLPPGGLSQPHTLSLGVTAGSPTLQANIFARGPPSAELTSALARSLSECGQPLPDVEVSESGPAGQRALQTDPRFGLVTLGQAVGPHTWKFSHPQHLPVWRQHSLESNTVAVLPHPRLPQRASNVVQVTTVAGGEVADAARNVVLTFAPGAFSQTTDARLTLLSGQTLPALLPLGWSPLQAFWLELANELNQPAAALLRPWGLLNAGGTVTLARWNEAALNWTALQLATGNGTNALPVSVPGSGAYALIVPDTGATAPEAAVIGDPLPASSAALPQAEDLRAGGKVEPATSPASTIGELVTAQATVTFTNLAGPMPSGVPLRCEVNEVYQMLDGTRRLTPRYETFVIGYQRPGDTLAATLTATFPLRPLLLLSGEELQEATVKVDVLAPGAFTGSVLETNGGCIVSQSVGVLSGIGDFASRQAATLRWISPTNFQGMPVGSNEVVRAFQLDVAETAAGKHLIPLLGQQTSNGVFVLGRLLARNGLYGVEPVERFASDAAGKLTSAEPATGERLPGITGAGQYLLLRMSGPQALVSGIASNAAGQAVAGLAVEVAPWLAFTDPAGLYRLLAPTGAVELLVTDLATGDTGHSSVTVTDPQIPVTQPLQAVAAGPYVISISPAAGAVGVNRVTAIKVNFSEPIAVGSFVPTGIRLRGQGGALIAGTLALNPNGRVGEFLPTVPLSPLQIHRVEISAAITDRSGLPIEGNLSFSFTTESTGERAVGSQLVIYEPGATNCPCAGQVPGYTAGDRSMICVEGTAGAAESGAVVILVNEDSGMTATVLAKADGSFLNALPAKAEDFISAVFVNANGTRTTLPASRQKFDDGRVGLYAGGGILEAESAGEPLQLIFEPGAIPSRSVFGLKPVALTELLALLTNALPEGGDLLGGMELSCAGDGVQGNSRVSIPFDPAGLNLQPGETPEDGAFVLAIKREVNGATVHQVVDKLRYRDGKLVSNSFGGLGQGAFDPRSWAAGSDAPTVVFATYYFLGTRPVTVSGRVYHCPGSPAADCGAAKKPLSGALVSLRPRVSDVMGAVTPLRPGQLQQGQLYSESNEDGSYALLADAGGEDWIVTATHPSYTERPQEPIMPYIDLSIAQKAITKNFYFRNLAAPPGLTGRPRISVSHEPAYPAVGEEATITVDVSSTAAIGEIQVEVVDARRLADGAILEPPPASVSGETTTVTGPNRKTLTAKVTCAEAAHVRLKVQVNGGDSVPYLITFGGQPPAGTDPIVSSDPNDHEGPMVLSSFPTQLGTLAPGQAIELVFSEPVHQGILDLAESLTVYSPGLGQFAKPPALELSPDQQRLKLTFADLEPNVSDYELTLPTTVTDLSGNALDQDPLTADNQPFMLRFKTAPLITANLPSLENGGGVVLHGAYAYALDRAGSGAIRVYDLAVPQSPVPKDPVDFRHGYPRDLCLIPGYAYVPGPNQSAVTNDLLAVVGGTIGRYDTNQDATVLFTGQFLQIYDLSNPTTPRRLVNVRVTLRPTVVAKVRWKAPYLAYLERGVDLNQVGLVNLQALLYGFADPYGLPDDPVPGLDANGDGDYVDPGEQVPIPAHNPNEFFGKDYAFIVHDTTRMMLDFAFDAGYCGVTLAGDASGPPAYRTVQYSGVLFTNAVGEYPFASNATPNRLTTLFDVPLTISNRVETKTLALVSLWLEGGGSNQLAVLDITEPTAPSLLQAITLPAEWGRPHGVRRCEDGRLALSMTTDLILLDPSQLAQPHPDAPESLHPAIVGRIPGAGSGNISNDGNLAGVQVINLGGRHQVVQTAPQMRYVGFPFATDLPDPAVLVGVDERVRELLSEARFLEALPPARLEEAGSAPSTLWALSPAVHYYVLLHAPGGAGPTLNIGLESLDAFGRAIFPKGRSFPPVHALSTNALDALGLPPRACDVPAAPLTAYRLSDDKTSPHYNLYLSVPFALTYERLSILNLYALRAYPAREVLWSGAYLRACLDPGTALDVSASSVLGAFAAVANDKDHVLYPPVAVTARGLQGLYIMGHNPPPLGGTAALPWTLGLVSAHNAEFRHTTTDLALPGPRLPITFARTIAGQDLYDGPFGRGWDFNYHQHLVELDADVFPPGSVMPLVIRASPGDSVGARSGDVLLHTGYGRLALFRYVGTNCPPEAASDPLVVSLGWTNTAQRFYLPEPGLFDLLFKFSDGRFVRLAPDGTQFWYGSSGRLEKIVHRFDKNQHHLLYTERGELRRITDTSATNRHLTIGYWRQLDDAAYNSDWDRETAKPRRLGKISRLVDFAGRDLHYEYNDFDLLTDRLDIEVAGENGGFKGRARTTYLWEHPACGDIKGIATGQGGGAALLSFQLGGPEDERVVVGGGGAFGSVTVTPPADNRATAMDGSSTTINGAGGATRTFTFDSNSYPVSISSSGPGAPAAVLQLSYSRAGLLTNQVYPEGNSVSYAYAVTEANLRSRVNLLTVSQHPRPGSPAEILTATGVHDPMYNLLSGACTDFSGNILTYALGPDKREVVQIDFEDAGSQTMAFNEYGQLEAATSPEGVVITNTYSASLGYLQTIRRGGNETRYTYNGPYGALGVPDTITPPRGEPVSIQYDARLQAVTITRGLATETRAYDEHRNLVRTKSALGDGKHYEETREYDANNFLRRVAVKNVEVNGMPTLEQAIEFVPDSAAPWRTAQIEYPGGEARSFTGYDHLGRAHGMQVGSYSESYDFDRNGNILKVRQGTAEVLSITPDGHDRVGTVTRPAAGTTTYTYHKGGELKSHAVEDPVYGEVSRAEFDATDGPDGLGRTRHAKAFGDLINPEYTMNYDGAARTATLTGPGETSTIGYDDAGFLSSYRDSLANYTVTPDGNGNITAMSGSEDGRAYSHGFTYNNLDLLTDYSDGVGTALQLNPRYDGAVQSYTDSQGQTVTLDNSVLGEPLSQTRGNGVQFVYKHDKSRGLSYVGDAVGGLQIEYDDAFRVKAVTRRDGSKVSYENYNQQNLPELIEFPGNGTMTPTWDVQGRLKVLNVSYDGGSGPVSSSFSYAYDALNRVRVMTSGSSSVSFSFDKAGPLTGVTSSHGGRSFPVTATPRPDGLRASVTYPSGVVVTEQRELASGRLTEIKLDGQSLYKITKFAGAELPEEVQVGNNLIQLKNLFDDRKRLRARRFEHVATSSVLTDARFHYESANDSLVARQSIHRNGRADMYAYDTGSRLQVAHLGARPHVDTAEPRTLPLSGEAPALGLNPGFWVRKYHYDETGGDKLDRLERTEISNPDALPVPAFMTNLSGFDALLYPHTVDGQDRGAPDPLGNTKRTRLFVRDPGANQPRPVWANLVYNGPSQLVRIEREDAVTIAYEYAPGGLCQRRTVTDHGTVASDRLWVYDGPRLIEEYEMTNATPELVARYYYAGGWEPVAADLKQSDGATKRFFYLHNNDGSVIAVADDQGRIVEQVLYDPWGQPTLEVRDDQPPRIERIEAVSGDLLLHFSESILPPLSSTAFSQDLITSTRSLEGLITLTAGHGLISNTVVYVESQAGAPFGATLRVHPLTHSLTNFQLAVAADALVDAWGKGNPAESFTLPGNQSNSTLYVASPAPATAPVRTARSTVASPFLFHGQYFDYDTGLVYLRARFYDPFTGLFLQQDPKPYSDSVNAYAAFAQDPVNQRDPRGQFAKFFKDWLEAPLPPLIGGTPNPGQLPLQFNPKFYGTVILGFGSGVIDTIRFMKGTVEGEGVVALVDALLYGAMHPTETWKGIKTDLSIAHETVSDPELQTTYLASEVPRLIGPAALLRILKNARAAKGLAEMASTPVNPASRAVGTSVLPWWKAPSSGLRSAWDRIRRRTMHQHGSADWKGEFPELKYNPATGRHQRHWPRSPYKDKWTSPTEITRQINEIISSYDPIKALENLSRGNARIQQIHETYIRTGRWYREGLDDFSHPDLGLRVARWELERPWLSGMEIRGHRITD